MISDGVVKFCKPKSEIFSTKRPSIKQFLDLNFPCNISQLCKYAIPYEQQNGQNEFIFFFFFFLIYSQHSNRHESFKKGASKIKYKKVKNSKMREKRKKTTMKQNKIRKQNKRKKTHETFSNAAMSSSAFPSSHYLC